jgi:osmotically-inducible protein OsmY
VATGVAHEPGDQMLDVSVPMTVDVKARDGFVTLTGTAAWHYQREAAESRITDVPGVAGIDNAISLTPAPDARGAADAISAAGSADVGEPDRARGGSQRSPAAGRWPGCSP